MPIVDGSYVAPTWNDDNPPAMDAAEMQALTDTVEANQNDKAPLASPTFTGTPTTPTPTDGDNSTKIASTAFVQSSVGAAYPTDTASGAIASFSDGADNIPVKSLTAQITPVQSGTGDPSPSNPRPITGWTGAEIADVSDYQQYFAGLLNGTYGFSDLSGLSWAQTTDGTNRWRSTSLVGTILAPPDNDTVGALLCVPYNVVQSNIVASTTNSIGVSAVGNLFVNNGSTTTSPTGIIVWARTTPTTPVTPTQYNTLVAAFNIGGWLVNVDWTDHGTVFGGTAEYLGGGQWRVTPRKASVDMGSLPWTYVTNYAYPYFQTSIPDDNINYASTGTILTCSIYKSEYGRPAATFRNNAFNGCIANITNGGFTNRVEVQDSAITSADDFIIAVTGQTLVYELATPLTPFIVDGPDPATLLGDNNVWSDTGDVSVTYRADVGLYIQKLIGG